MINTPYYKSRRKRLQRTESVAGSLSPNSHVHYERAPPGPIVFERAIRYGVKATMLIGGK
jgi:hypothetical protein